MSTVVSLFSYEDRVFNYKLYINETIFYTCSECHAFKIGKHADKVMDTETAVNMMISLESDTINSQRINGARCNVFFLCHVASEMDRLDLRRDGMGVWTEGHCRTKIPVRGKTKSHQEAECDSYVWRIVYSCESQPTLRGTEIYRKK